LASGHSQFQGRTVHCRRAYCAALAGAGAGGAIGGLYRRLDWHGNSGSTKLSVTKAGSRMAEYALRAFRRFSVDKKRAKEILEHTGAQDVSSTGKPVPKGRQDACSRSSLGNHAGHSCTEDLHRLSTAPARKIGDQMTDNAEKNPGQKPGHRVNNPDNSTEKSAGCFKERTPLRKA